MVFQRHADSLSFFLRIRVTRFAMRVFRALPLRKAIFFSSYEGKQYSCNPKALFEALYSDSRFSEYEFVWEINNVGTRALCPSERVSFVRHGSLKYYTAIMTCSCLITNSGVSPRFPLRRRQLNINTWHGGGGFKKVGRAANSDIGENTIEHSVSSAQTSIFVSSSRLFTEVMSSSIDMPEEKFLPIGMPRNDIFFNRKRLEVARMRVVQRYNLDEDSFIVLYAPTYRGAVGSDDMADNVLSVRDLKESFRMRFGKAPVVLVRAHYFRGQDLGYEDGIDANDYPDMQDLLVASDSLITDYSSTIWDYGLTGKPCFIYAYDLNDYERERGFYTEPRVWPGVLAKTEIELNQAVRAFDAEKYRNKVDAYYENSGSFENGTATQALVSEIGRRLGLLRDGE